MIYQKIFLAFVLFISGCLCLSIAPLPPFPPNNNNPCAVRTCPRGTECRLQQVWCVRAPCYVQSRCIQPRPSITSCPIERPVIGMNLADIICRSDVSCPAGTYCRQQRYGRGGCCLRDMLTEPVEKPGFCRPPTLGFRAMCISRCNGDFECPGTQKCCRNGCGSTCQNVLQQQVEVKPGSCPVIRNRQLGQRCSRPCSIDTDCAGIQKCCESGGCGRICRNPVNGPGICPIWNPNCRLQ